MGKAGKTVRGVRKSVPHSLAGFASLERTVRREEKRRARGSGDVVPKVPSKVRGRSEAEVKREITNVLKAFGLIFLRINSGNVLLQHNGKTRRINMAPPGTADFVCWVGKQTLWIEAKSPIGRQRPDQKVFQALVEKEGHEYVIARDADAVYRMLEAMRITSVPF